MYAAPYDFAKGESELRRAIDLSPSSAIAHQFLGVALVEQGRLAEGIEAWNAARDLDPLSPFMPHLLAYAQLLRRDYAGRSTEQRQANELGPPFSIPVEVEIYIQNAAFDEALVELDRVTPGREREPNMRFCRAHALSRPRAGGPRRWRSSGELEEAPRRTCRWRTWSGGSTSPSATAIARWSG